jgi:hypothetical protein
MKKLFVLLIFCLFIPLTSVAQLTEVEVIADIEKSNSPRCDLSDKSMVASVESVLRSNQIKIRKNSPVVVYLRVISHKVSSDFCAVTINLKVFYFSNAPSPINPKPSSAITVLCERDGLNVNQLSNIQSVVNSNFRSQMEVCISEIEKM